ncbi:periplasmic protein [Tatumella ptyseos ATCC 33301]|uniref:Periplasmic protein n=2 Tax=Tatumella ptyseos TaxID=82987 RepID=A0A085JN85_9GAMM|nr:Spy/CpxP family protein refolding chaperone [Tatumella ptyseos]KFD21931.1 periplasmic protein [Tatumella ptyseos ATCC 33301]SQK77324.1 Periplasmic protein CpxP precursor [Tatumella ptyseos]
MRQLIFAALSSLVIAGYASAQDELKDPAPFMTMTAESMTADSMAQNLQNHMFDGIELTEQQRQQMRDLMFQARQMQPELFLSEMIQQYRLVTAPYFDEAAVRTQAEKMAQRYVSEQVEMARVRHQMFTLLTRGQQATVQKNFELRIDDMRDASQLP